MSSNRSKTSKRLSLRKSKTAKSPMSKKKTQQISLGLPVSLALNTSSTNKMPHKLCRDRPKSANFTTSKQMQAALQNLFENTSIKPRSFKTSSASKAANSPSKSTNCTHITTDHKVAHNSSTSAPQRPIVIDEDDDDLGFFFHGAPSSLTTDNLSGSSISDILGPMSSLHEDSDDEERTKAMFSKLDHMNLGSANKSSKKSIRKIQSHPVIANAQSLFPRSCSVQSTEIKNNKSITKNKIIVNKTHINHNLHNTENTSPSSESTANTEKDSNSVESIQCTQRLRFRSQSMSSNPSMDDDHSYATIPSYIKSVPETNAIIKTQDGLMTYIGTDTDCVNNNHHHNNLALPRAATRSHRSRDTLHHRSLSSLGKDKKQKRQKRKSKQKQKRGRYHSTVHEIGYRQENILKRDFYNNNNNNNSNDNNSDEYASSSAVVDDGVKCEMQLNSEWDCLSVSTDQEWVALFSRNSMTLLRITEYGEFEQLRDLKAGRKDSRLKYGAVDAQFYYNDPCKLITCTRSGTLIVLNLNHAGRGCIALTNCPLKQRVHKVTWIKQTDCCLAAAEDGKCYLWDTRCDPNPIGMPSFNSNSSALSVKTSPFNDNLFASSHKNGTLSVWDRRKECAPFLTMTAHEASISCIDWHPAIPNIIASCGYRDRAIKIWNLTDDDVAQRKYSDYWNKMSLMPTKYNSEDDYRLGSEGITSPSFEAQTSHSSIPTYLTPNCNMYPSGYVSQIGWRPCHDPRSLSANQIACSYIVGSEQVVEMWDIKSSYVPVASLSSHESETKFKFIHRELSFLSHSIPSPQMEGNSPRTYIITCSKDKKTKLTDCGYAGIPRSKLSSCALDIAPFGSTCFVSVARQKLHPFDGETYEYHDAASRSVSDDASEEDQEDDDDEDERSQESLKQNIKSSSSMGELRESLEHKQYQYRAHITSISSDSEDSHKDHAPSSTRSVSTLFNVIFSKKHKRARQHMHVDENIHHEESHTDVSDSTANNSDLEINAMSGGIKQSKILQLTDIFNHCDAFSTFETNLTCYPLSEMNGSQSQSNNNDNISPCDSWRTFKYLATHYKLSGKSIPSICKENEIVAQYINDSELQTLWNLLGVLLQNVLSSNNNQLPAIILNGDHDDDDDDDDDDDRLNLLNSNDDACAAEEEEENDDDDDYWCWWMDRDSNECYSPGAYISSASNHSYLSMHSMTDHYKASAAAPLKQLEYALNDEIKSNNDDDDDDSINNDSINNEAAMVASYIKDVLLENIDRGDIQTAVTIIVMLDKYITQYLSQEEIADIVLSYLDLLLHSKLLIEAVKIYQLTKHYPLVERYFLSSHRLISKCIRCKDIMRDYQCFKCRRYARCTQCNEELVAMHNRHAASACDNLYDKRCNLKKLLIWCQICGHGGHFEHMKEWFSTKRICCVENCSHECQPVLIAI